MNRQALQSQLAAFHQKLIEDEKSPATIDKYCRDIAVFLEFAGEAELGKELVIAYKNHLLEHYAPNSVNSMLTALNIFLKSVGRYDCVVKTLKIQRAGFRSREKELSREEYYRLLKAAKNRKDMRLYMLMQTLGSTGIRISELRFITVEAVRRGRATVSLKGKTEEGLGFTGTGEGMAVHAVCLIEKD